MTHPTQARDDFLEWSVANTDIASIHVIYGGSHGPIRNAKLKRDLQQVGFASEENRPWDELMGFQFCVGMQGNQGATRWDLMYVIATGCVLLMHQPADHVFDEWWYPLLQENRHYLRFESSSELRNLWARLEGDRCCNFDIIWDHFPRISQLHPTPHTLCTVFYSVFRLTSC